MELSYYRRESGRVQTVVMYMPDVRACLPTQDEWQLVREQYKAALHRVLGQNDESSPQPNVPKDRNSNPPETTEKEVPEAAKKEREEENVETIDAEDQPKETPAADPVTDQKKEEKAPEDPQPMEDDKAVRDTLLAFSLYIHI